MLKEPISVEVTGFQSLKLHELLNDIAAELTERTVRLHRALTLEECVMLNVCDSVIEQLQEQIDKIDSAEVIEDNRAFILEYNELIERYKKNN